MRYQSLLVVAMSLASCGEPVASASYGAEAKTVRSSSLPLDAKGLPKFRPGLWEVARTDASDGAEPERERVCLGEEANSDLTKLLTATGTATCTVSRGRDGGGIQVTSECLHAGVKLKTSLDLAGSETAYRMKLLTEIVASDGTRERGEVTADARWVSACPAGMASGDAAAG